MRLYKFFSACRIIALTASVKVHIGSLNMARNEQVCAHQKLYREYIYAFMHLTDCSCAPILQLFSAASDGATANCQIPNRIFGQFFTSLRKDSVANYASIWTVFLPTVRTRCALQVTKRFDTTFANLRWKFSKT